MRANRRVLRGAALIRPGRDEDAAGYIALISACWAEYPGCILDVDAEAPELRALASYYARRGGALWVAGLVLDGMIATVPAGDRAWEICRVYVHPRLHGAGLGQVLLHTAEAHAILKGAERLLLWSDTRFVRAHRFYERQGYARQPGTRALHDIAQSVEYEYGKSCCTREAPC